MINDFAKVNGNASKAVEQFTRTMEVYEFLKANKGEKFRPIEIAEKIGYSTTVHYSWLEREDTIIHYSKVTNPLYWLKDMKLVDFEEVKEPIEIEFIGRHTKTVEVDGETYTRVYWGEGKDTIISKKRYWFAL